MNLTKGFLNMISVWLKERRTSEMLHYRCVTYSVATKTWQLGRKSDWSIKMPIENDGLLSFFANRPMTLKHPDNCSVTHFVIK